MKLNKKSGFTLLEIIIVIIIVGVLASLALPRFFSTVEFSRSTEALNSLGVVRKSIERCAIMDNNSIANCDVFNDLDMSDPGAEANAHFSYAWTSQSDPLRNYTITATRLANDGGNAGDTIVLTVNNGANTIVKSGTGAFLSIK